MAQRLFATFYTCVLISSMVTSSPVLPAFPVHQFSPVDTCLFMCNICFDDMIGEMMTCANNVCLAKSQFEMNLGLLKLGRTCKNYEKIEDLMFGNETD